MEQRTTDLEARMGRAEKSCNEQQALINELTVKIPLLTARIEELEKKATTKARGGKKKTERVPLADEKKEADTATPQTNGTSTATKIKVNEYFADNYVKYASKFPTALLEHLKEKEKVKGFDAKSVAQKRSTCAHHAYRFIANEGNQASAEIKSLLASIKEEFAAFKKAREAPAPATTSVTTANTATTSDVANAVK